MSTNKIQFHDIIRKLPYMFFFLQLYEEFRSDLKKEFELAMVHEPLVFESSRFYCIKNIKGIPDYLTPDYLCLFLCLFLPYQSHVFLFHIGNLCFLFSDKSISDSWT